jgi:nitrate reductase NapE component
MNRARVIMLTAASMLPLASVAVLGGIGLVIMEQGRRAAGAAT